jgi:hypothetical protein
MRFPDRVLGGPIRPKRFLAHAALALALTAGCAPKNIQPKPQGNKSVPYSQVLERACEDLGVLPDAKTAHEDTVEGVKMRTYAMGPSDFLVTASTKAEVLQKGPVEVEYEALPNTTIIMNFLDSPSGLQFSGSVTLERDPVPSPWRISTKPIPNGQAICAVSTVGVKGGMIDKANTRIHIINPTPAVGA